MPLLPRLQSPVPAPLAFGGDSLYNSAMYEEFYGLRETPFSVQPDPRYAFPSVEHKIALAKMRYAVDGKRGLAVLTGPVGMGKTTVANGLQMTWDDDPTKTVAFLPGAPVRTPGQFLRLILEAFGTPALRTEAQNRQALERFLLDEYQAGRHPVLLLDEGQNVASRVIDAISDLTNFQTSQTKLLTVVMLAQDNLPKKLERHDAFRSRIAVVGHLDPLDLEEMSDMIAFRIATAGGGALDTYFEAQALADVHAITRGVPRDVCVLCDALFVNGYVRDQRLMTPALVARTLTEMSREKKWPVKLKDTGK